MDYKTSRLPGREPDKPKSRNAWDQSYDDDKSFTHAVYGKPRTPVSKAIEQIVEPRHQTMDTIESVEVDALYLKKTEELFASIENLRPLIAKSREELKSARTSRFKSSADSQTYHTVSSQQEYLHKENNAFKAEVDRLNGENNGLKNQLREKEAELQNLERSFNEMNMMNHEIERYKGKDINKYQRELNKRQELEEVLKQYKAHIAGMTKECETLKMNLAQLKEKNRTLEIEKRKVEEELSDNKTRLSRLMSNKVSDNNPDIADLSDKNRPTKLAEKFTELYDNEWTDAFEVLDEYFHDEQKSIQNLISLLKNIMRFCETKNKEQFERLVSTVAMGSDRDVHLPTYVKKQLKDIRRSTAELSIPELYQSFIAKNRTSKMASLFSDGSFIPFVKGSVELCWLMSVQDPPIVFGSEPSKGDVFDTNLYKHYTKIGPNIEFIIWPPLLLHESGPLLCKGVAQGFGQPQRAPGRSRGTIQTVVAADVGESVQVRPKLATSFQHIEPTVRTHTNTPSQKPKTRVHAESGLSVPSSHTYSKAVKDTTNHSSEVQRNVVPPVSTRYRGAQAFPGVQAMKKRYSNH